MRHILNFFSFFIIAFAIKTFFFSSKPSYEENCGFVQNSRLERVSLKKKKIQFYIHNSIPEEFYDSLEESIQIWNDIHGKSIFFIDSRILNEKNFKKPKKDGVSVLLMMREWDENRPSEQARTIIYWEGNQIQEADILFNGKNFRFSGKKKRPFSGVHFTSLALHEFGHVQGLDHFSGGIMARFLPSGTLRLEADSRLLLSLNCEYSLKSKY